MLTSSIIFNRNKIQILFLQYSSLVEVFWLMQASKGNLGTLQIMEISIYFSKWNQIKGFVCLSYMLS